MPRLLLAIFIAKTIYLITRFLKIGGGSAAPGLYALKIDPNLVTHLASQIPQNIVITGTNGKTTTAKLLTHLLKKQDISIVRNATGSNLERGIASALLEKTDLWGNIKNAEIGIWEVDEAVFNTIISKIKPQIIVFLNAYRDQLDRYGEVDTVVNKWQNTLKQISWKPLIIVNNSDSHTSSLRRIDGVSALSYDIPEHHPHNEITLSPQIGSNKSDFQAKIKKPLGLAGNLVTITYPNGKIDINLLLPGIYQIYNLLACLCIYYSLNLPLVGLEDVFSDFETAFGRLEKIRYKGWDTYIGLIKNPVGTSSIIETLQNEVSENDQFIIALNDNFADGLDVSWIWDANFEILAKTPIKKFITSGVRASDMAVRLKYAGIDQESISVETDLKNALQGVKLGQKGRLFILLTYTALLSLQATLADLGIKEHYWKERSN